MSLSKLVLRPGAEKPLRRRHPWVFSGAVARVEGEPVSGDTVAIESAAGEPLALAAYSPRSQIRARIWSFDPAEAIDEAFFRRRLERALERRGAPGRDRSGAARLVYSESDRLPGLIVDRYGSHLVCQLLAAGAERWRDTLLSLLEEFVGPDGIFERSDAEVRKKEGLPLRTGTARGGDPPELIEIAEGAEAAAGTPLRLLVDVRKGHKTGCYLDQRTNRELLRGFAEDTEMLDVFSYTGGFALAALAGGASSVAQIDSSKPALALALRQAEHNGLDPALLEQIAGDAFATLRRLDEEQRQFDLVVLDPPKLVRDRRRIERAARAYQDINRLAFRLLRPGGRLLTFSCSGLLEAPLFQKIVADAALDAGVEAQLIARLGQADDHPTLLSFPEATYLKGMLIRV